MAAEMSSRPANDVTRELLHVRCIDFEGWKRSDGLFEIVGHLTDRKSQDFAPPGGLRVVPANEPIHDMGVRLVLDRDMIVRAASTWMSAYPYRGCKGGGQSLHALVGLRIGAGWSGEVKRCLPRGETCTHLREILIPLATAAIQSVNTFRLQQVSEPTDANGKPLKIDSCYAYGASRELVKERWPAFYLQEKS